MMGLRWCNTLCVLAVLKEAGLLLCCIDCALPTLSQVLSNRGCAQDGALQPLDEDERGRKRRRRRSGFMEKRRQHPSIPLEKKAKKKRAWWLTPCFDGITPTERLYGNTCQGDGLFPFTSSAAFTHSLLPDLLRSVTVSLWQVDYTWLRRRLDILAQVYKLSVEK